MEFDPSQAFHVSSVYPIWKIVNENSDTIFVQICLRVPDGEDLQANPEEPVVERSSILRCPKSLLNLTSFLHSL